MKEYKNCKYYESLCDIKNHPVVGFSSKNLVAIGTIGKSIPIDTGVSMDEIINADNPSEMIEKVSKETIDLFDASLNNKGED